MKKIPTLFVREFDGNRIVKVTEKVTPGMEWVLNGEGYATIKWDGSCCSILNGVFYKRYDAKKGKIPPINAIPCCEPDFITGHWPHWVPVDENNPADKWFVSAYSNTKNLTDGTYEAVGPHFKVNANNFENDVLVKHGIHIIDVPRSFKELQAYLANHPIEGIVFYKDDIPMCKIKRTDFGYEWPISKMDKLE